MTLSQLEIEVRRLATSLGLPEDNLPTFGSSRQDGTPNVTAVDGIFYYSKCERGIELERKLFVDTNQLLEAIFRDATFASASDQELLTRSDDTDARRKIFEFQEALIGKLSAVWRRNLERENAAILEKNPLDDRAQERVARFQQLVGQGLSNEAAWQQACSDLPLPSR